MPRLGLVIPLWDDISRDELIEFVKFAEELGYESVWVPEMWGRDVFTILTMLALHTEKIKLGIGIATVFSRTPALIAQTAASLDEISGGRVILGLGTSGPIVIENWHGLKFETPLQRTREYIDIIRLILSGKHINYEGEIFKLKGFRLQFKPLRDRIPIYVAALGPKNVMLTGELADGWIPFLVPMAHFQDSVQNLKAGARISGRNLNEITIAPYIPACVSDDVKGAEEILRGYIAYYVGGMGTFYNNLIRRYGFSTEARLIVDAWKKRDRVLAARNVTDSMLSAMSITGIAQQAKEKLDKYRQQGVDLPILIFPPKAPRNMVRETIIGLSPS